MPSEPRPLRSIAWSEPSPADAEAIAPGLRGGEDDVLLAASSCELMPGTGDKAKPNTLHRTAQPGAYMTAPSEQSIDDNSDAAGIGCAIAIFPGPMSSECGQTDE